MKSIITTIIFLSFFILSSCGSKAGPEISHIIVKSDSQGVVLDNSDAKFLKSFSKVFYDRDEHPEGGPTFMYLIDITTAKGTVRWQYNPDGNIRNFEVADSPIFQINDTIKFNRMLGVPNLK